MKMRIIFLFGSSNRLWRRPINIVCHKGQILRCECPCGQSMRRAVPEFRCYFRRHRKLFSDEQYHHLSNLNGCGACLRFHKPHRYRRFWDHYACPRLGTVAP